MSKYQYHQVESLSDLDLTFETKYYCFEEGVGHMGISSLQELSLNAIQSMIDYKVLCTRTEAPWYDNIPEHGVLCKLDWDLEDILLILRYDSEEHIVYDGDDKWYTPCSMTPLTNDEIKKFLREED